MDCASPLCNTPDYMSVNMPSLSIFNGRRYEMVSAGGHLTDTAKTGVTINMNDVGGS